MPRQHADVAPPPAAACRGARPRGAGVNAVRGCSPPAPPGPRCPRAAHLVAPGWPETACKAPTLAAHTRRQGRIAQGLHCTGTSILVFHWGCHYSQEKERKFSKVQRGS